MWSMPDNVLRYAAAGILVCALLGFTLGVTGAGPRTRLPGEQLGPVSGSPGQSASDALPINLEETPPPKAEEPAEEEETEEDETEKPVEPVAPPPAKVAEAPAPPQPPPPPAPAEPSAPPPAKEEPLY